jgi:ABC-type spermidine/putrescine transport system permease subunit II
MSTLAAELRAEAHEGRGQAARDALLRTALGLGTGFILLPLVIVIVYSFSSVSYGVFPPPGLSARWYSHLFEQTTFRAALATLTPVCTGVGAPG